MSTDSKNKDIQEVGRSTGPSKIVHEEYFVTPWWSLVGNVGGALGMFVGFSFIGATEKMMEFGAWMKNRVASLKAGQKIV